MFARAGIHDAETLRDMGADAAYQKVVESGSKPHFIGYYALVMGLQGRPWNDCQGEEKKALRKKFDTLKHRTAQKNAKNKGSSALEAALDEIGVIKRANPAR